MDSTNFGDIQSIHTMISNDTLIKKLHKEELCTCLKNTKLNITESSSIFQQIKSKYEIADRFDVIRNLSIDFGEMKDIEIAQILELLRIFGKCIEWDAINSIVEIIESAFSRYKQKIINSIKALKASCSLNFDQIYDIFNMIADKNDGEFMSLAIKEKLHESNKPDIFSYALEKNNFNLIRFMIESGIDYTQYISDIKSKSDIKNANYFLKIPQHDVNIKDNNTALIYASHHGKHEVVKLLLTIPGIDVNAKNNYNETALYYASRIGDCEVVKLLLTVPGIDVNIKDSKNRAALFWASAMGQYEVVKLLLTVPGIDVNIEDANTLLIHASRNGYHEVVKLILTIPGIDVNAKDNLNRTALIWASYYGRHEVVKLLLAVPGIDVNSKNEYNETALILASCKGYHEVVKLLLAVPGIDVNANENSQKN